MNDMTKYSVCFITSSPKQSREIARTLVEQKLVACVNIISSITSVYSWKEKVEEDTEDLLICKTCSDNQERIIAIIKKIHQYEVPETIFLPIMKGNEAYLKWIESSVEV